MDKKGVLGLDTVKAVMLVLLTLGILLVVSVLILTLLGNSAENAEIKKTGSGTNETITLNASVTDYLAPVYLRNCEATVAYISNNSNVASILTSGNYTQSGCGITSTSAASLYEGQTVNVTYTYTYNSNNTNMVVTQTTKGAGVFFTYAPTFFILLAVVVLILIIAIVIVAVQRFGGQEQLNL